MGETCAFRQLPTEQFAHGGESALEMLQMVQWWESYGYESKTDVSVTVTELPR